MRKIMKIACLLSFSLLSGCAGGAQEAASMPTPILCKTVLALSPVYLRYNEYLNELKKRNVDCSEYMGTQSTIRVR
jgi:hypothetical protein